MKINKLSINREETNSEELENIIVCAKWIVSQFENLNCLSLAVVFQRAIEDSEAWIKNMTIEGKIKKEYGEQSLCAEAETIRKLLIRYASIRDPEIRNDLLKDMVSLTTEKTH